MNIYALVWLGLMVLFLIIEAETVCLLTVWFACGALAAMVISLFALPLWLQIGVFFAVSAAMLALLRPMVKKHFTPKLTKTNVDAVLGKQAVVITDIDNVAATGQIKLNGLEWTARSTDGTTIAAGTQVKVDRIQGVTAYVSPVNIPVNTK